MKNEEDLTNQGKLAHQVSRGETALDEEIRVLEEGSSSSHDWKDLETRKGGGGLHSPNREREVKVNLLKGKAVTR